MSYWQCSKCFGSGRVIVFGQAMTCEKCDGTGNAMVNGAAERHRRRLREIDDATNGDNLARLARARGEPHAKETVK